MGKSPGGLGAGQVKLGSAAAAREVLTGVPREAASAPDVSAQRDAQTAVVLDGVSKAFASVAALRDCSLRVSRGAFVSLLGPSGCGKTTLLRIVGGFERQDGGTVSVHGERVDHLPPNRREVNTVFQRYALFPHRSVKENIAFPLELKRVRRRDRDRQVAEMLNLVQLAELADRRPSELSGGQAQRIALARALIGRPQVLLLDEPLAALDLNLRKTMRLELRRIHEEVGTTFLYVTHDQEEALAMSDTVALMNEGRLVQQGTPRELYERPETIFASQFLGETNLLHGTVARVEADATRVDIGGTTIAAAPAKVERGAAVAVSVRPERLTVSLSDDLTPGVRLAANQLRGTVTRQVFLGNVTHVLVDTGRGTTVTVECDHTQGAGMPPGTVVAVAWIKDDSVLLPAL